MIREHTACLPASVQDRTVSVPGWELFKYHSSSGAYTDLFYKALVSREATTHCI